MDTPTTWSQRWLVPALLAAMTCAAFGCDTSQRAQPDATPLAIDPEPELYCADTCHGACGPNCNACQKQTLFRCVLDGNGQNTGYEQMYENDTCGSHAGCRLHDDCLQTCANNSGCNWSPVSACALQCDYLIHIIYPPWWYLSWIVGGGPYDSYLTFNYDQGAPYWNGAACPPPTSGGGGGGGGGGGCDDEDCGDDGCCDDGCCDDEDQDESMPGHRPVSSATAPAPQQR